MSDTPQLSVLLPSLHERLLRRTLANIQMAAGHLDYEVVVVSPFEVRAPRVVWVPERERGGTARAHHEAFRVSRGALIAGMADDATLAPGSLVAAFNFHTDRSRRFFPYLCGLVTPSAIGTVWGYYYATFPFVSRAALAATGGSFFDPEYRTGWCDADLSLRIWAAGGRCEAGCDARIAFNPDRMGYADPVQTDVWSPARQRDLARFVATWEPRFGRLWSVRFRDFNLDLPVSALNGYTLVNTWPPDTYRDALVAPFNVEVHPVSEARLASSGLDVPVTTSAVTRVPSASAGQRRPEQPARSSATGSVSRAPAGPRRRVLLVPLEFARWQRSRSWSYAAGLGFEEGLEAHGFSCTVLPALSEYPSFSPRSWLYHAPRLLEGERFDQVWVWMTHTTYDPAFLEWLKGAAPVRIGVIMESMDYTPAEYALAPHLLARRDFVERQLRAMTHVLAMDEVDAAGFEQRLGVPAMWLPTAAPRRTLRRPAGNLPDAPATFIGDLYGRERAALLDNEGLRSLIVKPHLPENDTSWPERFDALQRDTLVSLTDHPPTAESLTQHVSSLRQIRRALYDLWLDSVQLGSASVNLPSLFKSYSGRVVESMSAGVPVVSWDSPHRPANRSLFAPGREIRLFERNDAEALAGHLRDLRADPAMARAQAEAAFHLVEEHHTVERRVEQVLGWLESGVDRLRQRGEPKRPRAVGLQGLSLPDAYRRREAATENPAVGGVRSDAYPLVVELAIVMGCTRLIDVGCPEPASCVRASARLVAVALCSSEVARAYERRCPDLTWRVFDRSSGEVASDVRGNEQTFILCATQFERAPSPLVLARTLARLLGDGSAGLIVSVDRERTWGADDPGPPPQPAHLQEWSAAELAVVLREAGLDVLHQACMPAELGRRELTCVATVVVANGALEQRRAFVTAAASTVIDAYVRRRETASSYELFEASERVPPVLVRSSAANASATPTLHALLSDDRWMAVHSARAPVEEATRWAERLEPANGAPVVLFGLGLGYQALALAGRLDAGRVIVIDPLTDAVARARDVAATRQALEECRIEMADSWKAFKRLAAATGLDLSGARFLGLPVYQRLADEDYATCSTLVSGAIAWAREGLEERCKPFYHPDGLSVVISTFDRVSSAIALVECIASQQPCGAPVEVLVINDHGTCDVFAAARDVARRTGCVLRTFDTRYTGYGLTLARNIGLRHASYGTTVFLDDDLEVGLDLLRRYWEAPEGVRMGRIDFTFEEAGIERHCPDRRIALQGPDRALRPWSAFEGFMWGGNCAVPTELALALGGFDETFLGEGEEDLDFSVRAVGATHRPVAVPSALATHQGLDRNGRVWLGFERFTRPGRANDRLKDPARGPIVNGGIEYWAGGRWDEFKVD